jgi:hypothetical protein
MKGTRPLRHFPEQQEKVCDRCGNVDAQGSRQAFVATAATELLDRILSIRYSQPLVESCFLELCMRHLVIWRFLTSSGFFQLPMEAKKRICKNFIDGHWHASPKRSS